MSDLLVRDTPLPLTLDGDERPARADLRRQIGRLEYKLSRLVAEGFPRVAIDAGVAAVSAQPRALGLGELERIAEAGLVLERRSELETRNRELLDRMLASPSEFKGLKISRADVGEPGCGGWHSQPRLGMLGML